MPATIISLLIGLLAGGAIGYLAAKLRNKSSGNDSALLDDYKKQLEAERSKTENSIKLTAELTAMKSTVEKLSVQSHEQIGFVPRQRQSLRPQLMRCGGLVNLSLMKLKKLLAHFQIAKRVENLVRPN